MARKRVRVISRNGKRYLSLAYAAPLIGYHKDYLGQLIRRGKLKGERIGTTWFIEESIFTKFCEAPHTFISSKESSEEKILPKERHQEKSSDEGDVLYANVLGELKAIHSKLADLAGSPPPRKKHSEKDILETQGVVSAQKEDLETSTFPTRSIVTTRHAFQRDEWDTVLFGGQDNEAKKLETPSEVAQVTARERAGFVKKHFVLSSLLGSSFLP
ncbi:MAG: hypothetical protein HYY92_02780 [Parcubacteria group bacterium]|nr:hypothetical protein [Parcubacteria group bacterium]